MKVSTWLMIAGGAWFLYEQLGSSASGTGATGSLFTTLMPTLSKIDTSLPGGSTIPAAGGVYLIAAGAVMRFGFGK